MSKMTNNKLALLALASLGAFASGPAIAAGGMTVDSNGGLEVFELDTNHYWFKIGGRLHIDQAFFDNDDDTSGFPSGSQIRRARVTLKGGVGNDWIYKLDVDYDDAPFNPGRSRFGEAFIGYAGCKNFWFALGQISVPFGLENWASANDTPFMELSLPSEAFSPFLSIGLYGEWHGEMVTVAGTIYHPGAGSFQYGDVLLDTASNPGLIGGIPSGVGPFGSAPGSDPLGFAGRVTFSPVHDNYTVYHAGISARYEDLQDHANNFNYFTGLEARARQTPVIFTNIPPNSVEDHHVWGFELAGRWGPFILQGEYMLAEANREDSFPPGDLRNPGGELEYRGYYVAASYVLTGETKDYDFESGTFGRVHPSCHKGAWEILVRHSFVDLLDNSQLGALPIPVFVDSQANIVPNGFGGNDLVGSAHSTTVGLTWWVNDNVRFMANYVRTDLPQDFDVNILGLRAQVNW